MNGEKITVDKINELFQGKLRVINMGLEVFSENLKSRGVETLQMNWRPPAGGSEKLASLLKRLGR
jgi:hypothetical protein